MQIRLLGPIDLRVHDQIRAIAGLRRKALVAALALEAGHLVSADRLIDLIWGACPPPGASQTLQSHVSQLRRFLGDGALIRSVPPGYVLELPGEGTDVALAQRLIRQGGPGADPSLAAAALQEALGLWRGRSLAELAGWAWFDDQARWLEGLRLHAARALAEHRLALGELTSAIPDLESLVRDVPLDEDLHRLLMLALYRSGRQVEALGVYRDLRRTLTTELGVEPCQDLRDLEAAVLRQDPALTRIPPTAAQRGARRVPAAWQLPQGVSVFTGREAEIRRLDSLIWSSDGAPTVVPGSSPAIVVVSGAPGVGKTCLALHWAHEAAHRFPDGQLYVNLRGFGPQQPLEPGHALSGFLEALGIPNEQMPVDVERRAGLYRSLLTGRRILLLLDNARNAAQVRPLLPGSGPATVVVTSRSRLTGLAVTDASMPLPLDVLSRDEAAQLLARRLGDKKVGREPDATDDLVALCARMPLALAIVAARAAHAPGSSLAALASELATAENALGVLETDDEATDIRTVFSWSYHAVGPAAARLFRLLAIHPGPDVTTPAAASLARVTQHEAVALLGELAQAGLIDEPRPGRYQAHDLLLHYAAELCRAGTSEDEQRAALVRLLDHYSHTAHSAALLLGPLMVKAPALPALHERPEIEELKSHDAAWNWFTAEKDVLLAATRTSAALALDHYTWHLAMDQEVFLLRLGRWAELAEVSEFAVMGARRMKDRTMLALALRQLSRARSQLRHDDPEAAYAPAREALHLFQEVHEHNGAALALMRLGAIDSQLDRHHAAIDHARRAYDLYGKAQNTVGQAQALNSIGWHLSCVGEHDAALECCLEALPLLRSAGDQESEAGTWDSIGVAQHHLRRYDQARKSYGQALSLAQQVGHASLQAEILLHLAETDQLIGRDGDARDDRRRALAILDRLGAPMPRP